MNGHQIATWLVNAVIAIALMEGVLLILLRIRRGDGPAPADIVANLGAGLCLLGALRSELAGAGWAICAAWLAASGVSHALDTWRRWPRQQAASKRRRPPVSALANLLSGTKRQT